MPMLYKEQKMRLLDELHRCWEKMEGNDLGQDNTSASSCILGLGKLTRLCCFFFRPGIHWWGLGRVDLYVLLMSVFERCGAFLFVPRRMQLNSSRDIFWFDGHGKNVLRNKSPAMAATIEVWDSPLPD